MAHQLFDLERLTRMPLPATHFRGGATFLYAIRCGEFIKVGVANNMSARVSAMQTGNPHSLEVIAALEFEAEGAARFAEKAAHHFMAQHVHRGEWFKIEAAPVLELLHSLHAATPAAWVKAIEADIEEARAYDRKMTARELTGA
jgi:hypothetical protein